MDASTIDAAVHDAALPDATSPGASDASPAPDAAMCPAGPVSFADSQHACSHAEHGPYQQATASRKLVSAPDVSEPHTHFTIAAPAEEGEFVYLRFESSERGDYAFFLRGASLVEALSAGTGSHYAASREWPSDCALLPVVTLIDLRELGFHTLTLRMPAGATSFGLVIEPLTPGGENACTRPCDAGTCEPVGECRSSGPCTVDADCCLFCHDGDHCH